GSPGGLAPPPGPPALSRGQNPPSGLIPPARPGARPRGGRRRRCSAPAPPPSPWALFRFPPTPPRASGYVGADRSPTAGRGRPAACEPGTASDFESFVIDYPSGAMAQIAFGRYHRGAWGDSSRFLPQTGFQIYAERGAAWLELPDRIQWSDASGTHDERLPLEPTVGDVLNEQFHRLVRGDQSLAP